MQITASREAGSIMGYDECILRWQNLQHCQMGLDAKARRSGGSLEPCNQVRDRTLTHESHMCLHLYMCHAKHITIHNYPSLFFSTFCMSHSLSAYHDPLCPLALVDRISPHDNMRLQSNYFSTTHCWPFHMSLSCSAGERRVI
jgi:hypothetical protein